MLLMVVLPTVLVKVEEPEVMVLTIADVETATEEPLALPPDPPLAAPKMVVEPTVEPPEVTADVAMGVALDSDE